MTRDFWRGKRILITGHTGFKGTWLSLWLTEMGAEVTGVALAPSSPMNLYDLTKVDSRLRSNIIDVRDLEGLQKVVLTSSPEIVLHLAAQPLVRKSYRDPVETYATNVMGTVHLLETIRHCESAKAVVVVTSDKCYENRGWCWGYREGEAMGGYDPYSSSKGCAELVTAAYRSSYFGPSSSDRGTVGIASARAGNVIGGGDWAEERLVPDILAAFQEGRPAVIRNPQAIRPWQFVLEPLRGYLTLAEGLYKGDHSLAEAWNFGPNDDDAKPVSAIADEMVRLWGDGASWVADSRQQPHEATYLKLDSSKAKNRLNWRPATCLADTLKMIIDWHRLLNNGEQAGEITCAQISAYENVAVAPKEGQSNAERTN